MSRLASGQRGSSQGAGRSCCRCDNVIGFYSRNLPILLSTLLCPLNYTRSGCRHWARPLPAHDTRLSSACLLLLLPFHFSTLRLRLWLAAALPARRTISGDRALPSPLSLSNTSPQAPSHCRNNTLSLVSRSHPPHTTPLQTHCLLFPLPSSSVFLSSSSRRLPHHSPLPPASASPAVDCPSPLPLLPKITPSVRKPLHTFRFATSRSVPRERLATIRPQTHTQQRTHNEDTRKHLGMPPHPQMPAPRVFPVSLPPPPSLQTLPPLTTHAQQPVGVRVRL